MTRLSAVRTASMALCLFALITPAFGQESDSSIQAEIDALKRGQEEIKKELAEIKRLLTQRAAPAPSGPDVENKVFDIGANPVKGGDTAPLTLVEFTDYQ